MAELTFLWILMRPNIPLLFIIINIIIIIVSVISVFFYEVPQLYLFALSFSAPTPTVL